MTSRPFRQSRPAVELLLLLVVVVVVLVVLLLLLLLLSVAPHSPTRRAIPEIRTVTASKASAGVCWNEGWGRWDPPGHDAASCLRRSRAVGRLYWRCYAVVGVRCCRHPKYADNRPAAPSLREAGGGRDGRPRQSIRPRAGGRLDGRADDARPFLLLVSIVASDRRKKRPASRRPCCWLGSHVVRRPHAPPPGSGSDADGPPSYGRQKQLTAASGKAGGGASRVAPAAAAAPPREKDCCSFEWGWGETTENIVGVASR